MPIKKSKTKPIPAKKSAKKTALVKKQKPATVSKIASKRLVSVRGVSAFKKTKVQARPLKAGVKAKKFLIKKPAPAAAATLGEAASNLGGGRVSGSALVTDTPVLPAVPKIKTQEGLPPKARPLKSAAAMPQSIEAQPVIKPKPPSVSYPKEEKPILKVQPPAREAVVKPPAPKKEEPKVIEISIPVVLKDLAAAIQEKPAVLIKRLLEYKVIATINQSLEEELARRIASQYGYQIKKKPTEEELLFAEHEEKDPSKLKPRPPIVTFMGHVDHGKTSLLDAIRKSKIADAEYGGITQHIGAYEVSLPGGQITFLDTPGHEAFTAMRARGAKVTDIVVLVVAADDGVMPQTIEAIDHAKVANVPIVVAINKIDKPQTSIDVVKKELAKLGLAAEDWGGKTITVGVSAKTGQGIDELLEMILLEAEMLELKASPSKLARGVVLEAKVTEGRGLVATLLVEDGTLYLHDTIIVGPYYAKIRAMLNEFGRQVKEAPPSAPVEILGLSGLPEVGEQFFALSDEKKARDLAGKRREELHERGLRPIKMMSLEDLSIQIKEGRVRELKLILKADVMGSLEAINEALKKLTSSEVKLSIIHQGVGSINVSDVSLSRVSGAIIMGFCVGCDDRSKEEANKSGVDIRTYNVIYELYNDLKTALEGLLEPKLKKIFLGRLLVRQVFKLSKGTVVAGCYVEKGKITRSAKLSLLRGTEVIFEGTVSSLKRFKDDVREVGEGLECGVSLSGFENIMQADIIEAYEIEKIARKLE